LKNREFFWLFSSTRELKRVFGCVILEQALLWVLLGLITMIEVDRSFEKSMLLFSSF